MATTFTPPEVGARPATGGGGFTTLPPIEGGGGGRGGPMSPERLVQRYKLGVWVGVGGIVMFFAALTSAMVVRKGLSNDWKAFDLPIVLYVSTVILLASSFTLEKARRAMTVDAWPAVRRWVNMSAGLGLAFLICQLIGWQALAERGLYLASNPANSFYYVLTAGHGFHLAGGILTLGYVWMRVRNPRRWPTHEAVMEAATLYWHFMDVLWIYILGLLLFWR